LHDTSAQATEMRMNRQANMQRLGVIGGGYNGSGISFATARPRDPMFYWRESNLPFEYTRDEEIIRLRQYARLVYLTDPVMASCIDVYSYWPLTGMHVEHKDSLIQGFYEELFFDENSGLNYEEFLPELLHEYWLAGEAFPLGHFNELLGIWEYDELINADDVKVVNSPFMREPRFEIKVPEDIRKIVTEREPKWEFAKLVQAYPEFLRLAQTEEYMPVSSDLMRQVAFKADKFHPRGLPIMMRAFRSLYQQEMLNAAMDSIASRLYTPLVLVRLGASAQDTGTDTAWVPTAQQLEEFQESLDIALAADFRVLTSHFATQVDLVFGREAMPDFGPDFDRLMDQKLLAFGLSRTMLMGASSGETYAADALNRDVVTQMLTRAQRHARRHFAQRVQLVAKAQEHYETEKQGGRSKIVYQEVLVVDPDGKRRVERKPKLMTPKLVLDVLNLHDEQAERAFIENLVAMGIPISARTRLRGTEINLDDELDKVKEEQVNRAIAAQETRKELYLELQEKRLPIEQDLLDDFQPKPEQPPAPPMIDPMTGMPMAPMDGGVPGGEGGSADQGTPFPSPAVPPGDMAPLTPTTPEMAQQVPPGPVGAPGVAPIVAPAVPQVPQVPVQPRRPPESDEQRRRMPRANLNGHTASNGHTNGNGYGRLHWEFTGDLAPYLANWDDDEDEDWGRQDHSEPIEHYLYGIGRRVQAFHSDPANHIEMLDPNDEEHRVKLNAYHDRASKKYDAWVEEASRLHEEGNWEPEDERRSDGLSYMTSALGSNQGLGSRGRVAVATHKGDVVGALAFSRSHPGPIHVHLVGSSFDVPGAGTALEHAVARHGLIHGANGIFGEPSHNSLDYHREIGRVVKRQGRYNDPISTWDRDDMRRVALISTRKGHLAAVDIEGNYYRAEHSDPMEPLLGDIADRVQAFHSDPHNKVEILDPNNKRHLARLSVLQDRADAMHKAWSNEVGRRREEGKLDGTEQHKLEGIGWTVSALRTHHTVTPLALPHERVAVATHKDGPVAAVSFYHDHWGGLSTHYLGSTKDAPGAATAAQHAMARYGVTHGVRGISGTPITSSEKYHRSIGRVVHGSQSSWDPAAMEQLAGIPTEAPVSARMP
jgi:hypothetical protein